MVVIAACLFVSAVGFTLRPFEYRQSHVLIPSSLIPFHVEAHPASATAVSFGSDQNSNRRCYRPNKLLSIVSILPFPSSSHQHHYHDVCFLCRSCRQSACDCFYGSSPVFFCHGFVGEIFLGSLRGRRWFGRGGRRDPADSGKALF